jgi:hypothetical protein
MYDLVHHPLRAEELFGIFLLVCVVSGSVVKITKAVLNHKRRTVMDDIEATLKMEMIQRGMSADEIAKVLQAKGPNADSATIQALAERFSGKNCNWKTTHAQQA